MTDYDIDIRNIEPEYAHTIASQAGREVDDGFEVHLSRFVVTLTLSWGTGSDYDTQAFAVRFDVDHDDKTVTMASVGDAHGERQSFGVGKLMAAVEYAHRAAVAFVEDVGPDYEIVGAAERLAATGDHGDDVTVHTALEVQG